MTTMSRDQLISAIRKDLKVTLDSKKSWDTLVRYFDKDHHVRYMDGWNLIEKHINGSELSALEVGPFPFFTYPLFKAFNWTIKCIGLDTNGDYLIPDTNIFLTWGNLCYDDLGVNRYDFIVCTEVLEHLPCNLVVVRDKLIKALKPGGFMLISYPLGGNRVGNYNKDLEADYFIVHDHLREFTVGKARLFFNETPMQKIDEAVSHPIAYPVGILQILYTKTDSPILSCT